MSLLNKIFGKKEEPIRTDKDFWIWFQKNGQTFFSAVKSGKNIEQDFFNKLSPKLDELRDGIYYLTGMLDENTAELVLTPDGIIKNIVFIEELEKAAMEIPNWKFTALKPALDIENVVINMAGYSFESDNLSFYPIDNKNYPDEVDIVIVYDDYNEDDKSTIINAIFIFIDNYLGELNSVTTIDNLIVTSRNLAEKELIPIEKLKDYLIWREKEFVEKYNGIRHNTENDNYSSFEAKLNNGKPLIAIFNTSLLEWDAKASHPWILKVEINYDGNHSNGLPDNDTYDLLNKFEEEIMIELKDSEGYLNVGRQTADNTREIYFACKEFRKSSKVLSNLIKKYSSKLNLTYDLYKDKYWQSFENFTSN